MTTTSTTVSAPTIHTEPLGNPSHSTTATPTPPAMTTAPARTSPACDRACRNGVAIGRALVKSDDQVVMARDLGDDLGKTFDGPALVAPTGSRVNHHHAPAAIPAGLA